MARRRLRPLLPCTAQSIQNRWHMVPATLGSQYFCFCSVVLLGARAASFETCARYHSESLGIRRKTHLPQCPVTSTPANSEEKRTHMRVQQGQPSLECQVPNPRHTGNAAIRKCTPLTHNAPGCSTPSVAGMDRVHHYLPHPRKGSRSSHCATRIPGRCVECVAPWAWALSGLAITWSHARIIMKTGTINTIARSHCAPSLLWESGPPSVHTRTDAPRHLPRTAVQSWRTRHRPFR